MAQKPDPWGVASVTPAAAPDPWGVASVTSSTPAADAPVAGAGDYGVPALPAHPAANMQASPLSQDGPQGTVAQKLFGDKPLTNSATVVGQHLKQLVTAPYHAFTDAPTSIPEQAVQGTQGQAALGLYRMLAKPTVEGQGMDRIPIAGPMARGVENDAQTYGAIPALLGLGTDLAAPKAAEGLYGGTAKLAGTVMQAAAATPEALKLASTRALVTGSPGEMLNRSLKPPVTKPDFEQSIEASLPSIAAQNPKGVSGFAQAAQNSKQAANDWYQGLTNPLRPFKVDASPIADAQMQNIPIMDRIEKPATLQGGSPGRMKTVTVPAGEGTQMTMGGVVGATPPELKGGIYNNTADIAANYRRPMPLGVVDDVRQDSNAKLNAFFNKSGGDKYAAMSNPETARVAAVNDASRDLAYNNFSRLSAAGRTDGGVPAATIAKNQNLYGQLSDVADVAGKRATVAGRANPLSLQESLQLHGNPLTQAYNFGTSRIFKSLTDSDAVTNAALDRFNYPAGPVFTPRPTPFSEAVSTAGKGAKDASSLKPFFAPSIVTSQGGRKRGLYD